MQMMRCTLHFIYWYIGYSARQSHWIYYCFEELSLPLQSFLFFLNGDKIALEINFELKSMQIALVHIKSLFWWFQMILAPFCHLSYFSKIAVICFEVEFKTNFVMTWRTLLLLNVTSFSEILKIANLISKGFRTLNASTRHWRFGFPRKAHNRRAPSGWV